MIVIATKTEMRLRDDLRKYATQKPNQRCFFLEFSQTDIPKAALFETFLKLLERIPNSYMARVYLCQDKDILIMMESFMQRQFYEFVKTLSDALQHKDFSELVDVMEVGVHWAKLEALYTAKLEAIQNAEQEEQEAHRKEIADQNTMQVMFQLDTDMVKEIPDRRGRRQRPLVMVADDDQLSRTLAGNVLRADYDLSFAKNGTEAMQEYVRSAPDILFLDIGMPDIGGHEVLETLFQLDPKAYIIMFSGRKDTNTIIKSLEKGAQGFLGKPFTREQLYSHVHNSPFVQRMAG